MGFIPPQTIQKFLTINADLIQNQAFRNACELGVPPVEEGIVLLSTDIPTRPPIDATGDRLVYGFARENLTDSECQQITIAQRKLLDPNNVPTYNMFKELFGPTVGDDHKKKYSNLDIKHKIILSFLINKNKELEEEKENILADIDSTTNNVVQRAFSVKSDPSAAIESVITATERESLQANYSRLNFLQEKIKSETKSYNYEIILEEINNSDDSSNKSLFFDNISITNKSKDAYTATSNYHVSMKFLFDDLNSIVDNSVVARCLDPDVPPEHQTKKIPLLKILHSFIDSNISNLLSNAVDLSKGLILVQECFLDNKVQQLFNSLSVGSNFNKFNFQSFTEEVEQEEADAVSAFKDQGFNYPYSDLFFTRLGKNKKVQGLSKSYHLNYYKHNYDVFKDKNSILSDLKNSITMEFVSFEADSSTNKQKSLATTPPIINNLYQLLNTTSASKLFSSTSAFSGRLSTLSKALENINEASKKIGAINQAISIYNTYQTILQSKNAELIAEINKEFSDGGRFRDARNIKYTDSNGNVKVLGAPIKLNDKEVGRSVESLQEDLEALNNDIKNIKGSINKALVYYILETVRRYSVLIPYKYLQTYDELTTFEAFKQNLSLTSLFASYSTATGLASAAGTAAASATGVTATIGTGLAAAGALLGGAVVVTAAGAALNDALTAEDIKGTDLVANKSREFLIASGSSVVIDTNFRSSIDQFTFTPARSRKANMIPITQDLVNNKGTFFTDPAPQLVTATSGLDSSSKYGIDANSSPEELAKKALEFGAIPVEERDGNVDALIDLKFVFFGDLVALLLRAEQELSGPDQEFKKGRTKIFMGGKIINDTARNKKTFLNFYFFPIGIQALTNFLNDKVLNSENLSYSTELFIKDIFDNIVKGSIASTDVKDRSQNLFVPSGFKNVVFNSFFDDSDPNDHFNKLFRKFKSDPAAPASVFNNTARHVNLLKQKASNGNDMFFDGFLAEFNFSKNLANCLNENTLCKVFCFYSDDQTTGVNFYEEFKNTDEYKKVEPKPSWNSAQFTNFLNKNYGLPTIIVNFPTINNYTITYHTPTLNFSRVDNSNLTTGNLLASNAIFRYPYSFSSDSLLGYMNFFMSVGSMFFITPPIIKTENIDKQELRQLDQNIPNNFGFGGLYVVKSTTFTSVPAFRNQGGVAGTDLAANKYKFSIEALHVGYGDGGSSLQDSLTPTTNPQNVSESAFDYLVSVKGKIKQ